MSLLSRKAEANASNVAVVIFLIAIFLAIYVLLLPVEDRAQLLGENLTSSTTDDNGRVIRGSSVVILSQSPGLLEPLEGDTVVHRVDPVNLFLRDEPKIDDLAASIQIRNGVFGDEVRRLSFNSEDLDSLDRANLFFAVREGGGNLIISLNGVEIFDETVEGLQTVSLPLNLLQIKNTLEFEASGPGWNIFGSNSYDLRDLKVRQSFEVTNTQEIRTFVKGSGEQGKGILSYTLFCNSAGQRSRLTIDLNEHELVNEIIACRSAMRSVEISSDDFIEGRNELIFQIDEGDYLLNDIKIEVDAIEGGAVDYTFSITEDEFTSLENGDLDVVMDLQFSDQDKHRLLATVNGDEFTVDVEDDTHSVDISRFVREGRNKIIITPQNEFTLDLLELRLI